MSGSALRHSARTGSSGAKVEPGLSANQRTLSISEGELENLGRRLFFETQQSHSDRRKEVVTREVHTARRLINREAQARRAALRDDPSLLSQLRRGYAVRNFANSGPKRMAQKDRPPDGVQWVRATTNIRPPEDCCIKSYVPYLGESDEKQQTAEDVANEIDESSSSEDEDSDVECLEPLDDPFPPSEATPKKSKVESSIRSGEVADGDHSRSSSRRYSVRKSRRLKLSELKWDRSAKMVTLDKVMESIGCSTVRPIARAMSKALDVSPSHLLDYARIMESRKKKHANALMDERTEKENELIVQLITGEHEVSAADVLTKGDSIPYYFCRRCAIYDCSLHGPQRGHPKDTLPDRTRKDTGPKHLVTSIESACKFRDSGECWFGMVSGESSPKMETVDIRIQTEDIPEQSNRAVSILTSNVKDRASTDCAATTKVNEDLGMVKRPRNIRGRPKSRYSKPCEQDPISFFIPLSDAQKADEWWHNVNNMESFAADILAYLKELLPVYGPDFCRLSDSLQQILELPLATSSSDTRLTCKRVGFICARYFERLLYKPEYTLKKPQGKSMGKSYQELAGGTQIRPDYVPCRHRGPCTKRTCPCVKNGFLCEKFCGCNRKPASNRSSYVTQQCPNLFKGCNCKSQKACMTNACLCFSWGRECDPDVCRSCHEVINPKSKKRENKCCNEGLRLGKMHRTLTGKSNVHGWGVFSSGEIAENEIVGEYVGELLEGNESERRGRIYDESHANYLFKLSHTYTLDSTRIGNKLRFVNHSSTPNCEPRMMRVNGDVRIGIYAKRNIAKHEELFFDYGPEFTQAFNKTGGKNIKAGEAKVNVEEKRISSKQKASQQQKSDIQEEESDSESFDSGSTQEPRPVKAEGEKIWKHNTPSKAKPSSSSNPDRFRKEPGSIASLEPTPGDKWKSTSKTQQTSLTETNMKPSTVREEHGMVNEGRSRLPTTSANQTADVERTAPTVTPRVRGELNTHYSYRPPQAHILPGVNGVVANEAVAQSQVKRGKIRSLSRSGGEPSSHKEPSTASVAPENESKTNERLPYGHTPRSPQLSGRPFLPVEPSRGLNTPKAQRLIDFDTDAGATDHAVVSGKHPRTSQSAQQDNSRPIFSKPAAEEVGTGPSSIRPHPRLQGSPQQGRSEKLTVPSLSRTAEQTPSDMPVTRPGRLRRLSGLGRASRESKKPNSSAGTEAVTEAVSKPQPAPRSRLENGEHFSKEESSRSADFNIAPGSNMNAASSEAHRNASEENGRHAGVPLHERRASEPPRKTQLNPNESDIDSRLLRRLSSTRRRTQETSHKRAASSSEVPDVVVLLENTSDEENNDSGANGVRLPQDNPSVEKGERRRPSSVPRNPSRANGNVHRGTTSPRHPNGLPDSRKRTRSQSSSSDEELVEAPGSKRARSLPRGSPTENADSPSTLSSPEGEVVDLTSDG